MVSKDGRFRGDKALYPSLLKPYAKWQSIESIEVIMWEKNKPTITA